MATTSFTTAILAGLALAASATVLDLPKRAGSDTDASVTMAASITASTTAGSTTASETVSAARGWWSPTGGYAANSDLGDCRLTVSLVRRRFGRLCR